MLSYPRNTSELILHNNARQRLCNVQLSHTKESNYLCSNSKNNQPNFLQQAIIKLKEMTKPNCICCSILHCYFECLMRTTSPISILFCVSL